LVIWLAGSLLGCDLDSDRHVVDAGRSIAGFRVERSAYRYASITLAIVMLVPRSTSAWLVAIHRFFEVSLDIAAGLMLSAFWPERQSRNLDHSGTRLWFAIQQKHLCKAPMKEAMKNALL
jgi:hypothetical protein